MKFLHTSDWQIGMKAIHAGDAAEKVREERIETIRKVMDVARENKVDFILVAGDVFENNAVKRVYVQRVVDILAKIDIPVFLIPGNHDPYTPGSVWEHPAWMMNDNIRVLLKKEPVEIPGGMLYPCPTLEKYSRKDPTAWIVKSGKDAISIGMAHGTVENIHAEELDHPIPPDAAERSGLDYLALGHWHSTTIYKGADGFVRMAYSGTHETTRFGERDSGNVLVVEIPEKGAPPVLTRIHVGKLNWKVIDTEIKAPGELALLRDIIEKTDNPENTLVDLKLKGLLFCGERSELSHIQNILTSRYLYSRIDTSDLIPSPADDAWITSLPPGIIRETAIMLRKFSNPGFTGKRPVWCSQKVATRALFELYSLIAEASK